LPILLAALTAAAITTARPLNAGSTHYHADIPFPEYHSGAACLRKPPTYATHPACPAEERGTRLKLLAQWQTIERDSAVAAVTCIDILQHPDAGPPSYAKLSDCIAGLLYAGE
jgi:hypothetical protein